MTNDLLTRTLTPYKTLVGAGLILVAVLIYPVASLNWTGVFLILGLLRLTEAWRPHVPPERKGLTLVLRLAGPLGNVAVGVLAWLHVFGYIFYHS